ncbi:MAG: hypothetical protein A3E88_02725 [Legionellales bacterium RIFCSPHIGHO2_12_FULL_35_11]|nr:MAG: hypothetical protein A3E88_02725 [Legionellales bacterium RIFCSPHIGHO2_12_FULL_35_11]
MKIWIDGDACPKAIKQILFRASMKRRIYLFIVSNHHATIPTSPYIKKILVPAGFDKADDYIVNHIENGDLVITSDIILANYVIEKTALALNPRGTLYSDKNIKQTLTMRNLNESLRNCGLIQGGPSALNPKDIQIFSNHLDKIITRIINNN